MKDLLPELCDKFSDQLQILEPVFCNLGGRESFGGEIVTLKTFEDNSKLRELVALPGEGKVLVVDGGGSMRCALLGDLLADKAAKNGWQGIIIYGCVRDINAISEIDIGVQALGVHPLKSVKRGLGDLNIAINFAGATFRAGEYLYADNNGIIVSPQALKLS